MEAAALWFAESVLPMFEVGAIALTGAFVVVLLQATVILLAKSWITGWVKSYFDKTLEDYRLELKHDFDRSLEEYKLELKIREQAAIIAEYASLAWDLKDTDNDEVYREANKLSWQLFLWLPDDIYRRLGKGLDKASPEDLTGALVAVRKSLLGAQAGTLDGSHIIVHRSGIKAKINAKEAMGVQRPRAR
jgi:hypothetical protein